MEDAWKQQIAEIERRARSVNLNLHLLCGAAGVRQNNLTRWKQGYSPSMRVFLREMSKLERALIALEYDMAIKLISQINPAAASRIAQLLQTPNAGGAGIESPSDAGLKRDSRRDGDMGGVPCPDAGHRRGHRRQGPDRAA